jgi:pimeloyl-ACP methyl ester carboxylesterase
MAQRVVPLHDGRVLGLSAAGDPAVDRVVAFCHPAPGSAWFDPDPELTGHWGIHIVGLDRPGYGSSTPLPDEEAPTIAGRADDMAEYLRAVMEQASVTGRTDIKKVGVIGWSAGGRVALALAARHPDLVDRVAVVGTPAPDSAVRWIPRELAEINAELMRMPPAQAKARLRPMLEQQVPGGVAGIGLLGVTDVDAHALERPGVESRLKHMLDRAYEQGTIGVADDILSYAGDDWGFDLQDVEAQVLLVYGAADRTVPSAHGRWYRRHLPHAHLTVAPRAGHLVVVDAWRQILEHVDPQHGRSSEV